MRTFVNNLKKSAMKKILIYIATLSLFALSSCGTNKMKAEEADEKLNNAAKELAEARTEVANDSLEEVNAEDVNAEEWNLYKDEMEAKIRAQEIRIASLKKSIAKSGSKESEEKIKELEEKNKSLSKRLKSFEKVKSDWISFKRKLSLDLDQLGVALKDFTVPSK
jgi:peptidoglycan hydrolase CwlO-like protein